MPSVDQGVELLNLLSARRGQKPVVNNQQLDFDESVEAAFLTVGSLGDRDPVVGGREAFARTLVPSSATWPRVTIPAAWHNANA